jgi:hypothetical protein
VRRLCDKSLIDSLQGFEQQFLVGPRGDFLRQDSDEFRARIDDAIFAMAHAHHQAAAGKAARHEVRGFVGAADFFRHFQRSLIGSAMQRAVQRSHRGGQSGCGRRQCGCHDTGREGTGVEAVIDLQNLGLLEDADRRCRRGAVVKQLQEALAVMTGPGVRSRGAAGAQRHKPRQCGGQSGGNHQGFLFISAAADFHRRRVERHQRHGRLQGGHRMTAESRQRLDGCYQARRQPARIP